MWGRARQPKQFNTANITTINEEWGFPGSWVMKICLPSRRHEFSPQTRKITWRRKWQPTPLFLPRKFHGWRHLVDYSPWSLKELNVTEGLIEGDREKKRKRERSSGVQDWN